jgi:hypothetical protein
MIDPLAITGKFDNIKYVTVAFALLMIFLIKVLYFDLDGNTGKFEMSSQWQLYFFSS